MRKGTSITVVTRDTNGLNKKKRKDYPSASIYVHPAYADCTCALFFSWIRALLPLRSRW